jgi:hypothetical protein
MFTTGLIKIITESKFLLFWSAVMYDFCLDSDPDIQNIFLDSDTNSDTDYLVNLTQTIRRFLFIAYKYIIEYDKFKFCTVITC